MTVGSWSRAQVAIMGVVQFAAGLFTTAAAQHQQGAGVTRALSLADVAGTYVRGVSRHERERVAIDEQGRFIRHWSNDAHIVGEAPASSAGRVVLVDGRLEFTRVSAQGRLEGMQALGRLALVPWETRLYLVQEQDPQPFLDAVNLGDEPRKVRPGHAYLRDGDWEEQAAGLPQVPPAWRQGLLREQVEGVVLRVLADGQAEISLGSAVGLRPGMALRVLDVPVGTPPETGRAGRHRHLKVEVVRVTQALGVVRPSPPPRGTADPGRPAPLAVGQRVASGAAQRPLRSRPDPGPRPPDAKGPLVLLIEHPPLPARSIEPHLFARWQGWVRTAFLRDVPPGDAQAARARLDGVDIVDATPAFLAALNGSDVSAADTIQRIEALAACWQRRQGHRYRFYLDPDPAHDTWQDLHKRVTVLERWAQWWANLRTQEAALEDYRERVRSWLAAAAGKDR